MIRTKTIVSFSVVPIALIWVSSVVCGDIAVVDTIFLAPRAGNGTLPRDVAVNSRTNKVYTANLFYDFNVSVIDANSDSVIRTVPVGYGSSPRAVCVNDSANRVYVANEHDHSVAVIDGEMDSVIATIPVGSSPTDICVNERTNCVYVTLGWGSSYPLYIIDGGSNTVMDSVPLGSGLQGVCVNDSTNLIYVVRPPWVYVIDGNTNTVLDSVRILGQIFQVEVSQKRNLIYASGTSRDLLYVIDGGTNTLIDSIAVAAKPYSICVNDSTDLIYLTHMMESKTVTVIDASSNSVVDTLKMDCDLQGTGIHSSLNRVYVAGFGSHVVGVIDGETNRFDTLITVGTLPFHISGNPATDRAYVTEYPVSFYAQGQLFALDVSADSAVGKIEGIYHANEMAIDTTSNLLWVTSDSHFVYIVDGATNSVADSIWIGSPSWGICRSDSLNRIFVTYGDRLFFIESDTLVHTLSFGSWLEALGANQSTGMIYVTDTGNDSVYVVDGAACSLVAAVGVGVGPYNLWVNSATNLLYVSNWGSRSITVVDGTTNSVMGSILLPYPPNGITGSEGTNRIYVADSNSVLVIDGFTNLVVDSATFGTLPVMEWFNPETGRLYVTDMLDGWVYVLQDLVAMEERQEATSRTSEARLMQNFPNPFTHTTTIRYSLQGSRGPEKQRRGGHGDARRHGEKSQMGGRTSHITLAIYDLSGRLIRTLVDEPSNHQTIQPSRQVVWDGTGEDGTRVPPGIYFCRFSCHSFSSTKKMVLLR